MARVIPLCMSLIVIFAVESRAADGPARSLRVLADLNHSGNLIEPRNSRC